MGGSQETLRSNVSEAVSRFIGLVGSLSDSMRVWEQRP